MKKILMIMGVACLAVSGRADTLLLSDNFNTKSESLAAFNSTLSTDQGGTLKPVTYTLANGGADWQIQHGNAAGGYQMLLAGSPVNANRDLYASLNHNFATEANTADEPLKIQFNIKITTVTANWATIAVGSVQNAFVTSGSYKFSSLFRGTSTSPQGTQQFTAGTDLGSANFTYVNNDQITLVLSDAAGTGSAFNGNATAKVYVNGTLKYTKTGLNFTAADGYISFEAYFVDGYYDNLAVSLVGTKTVTYNGNGNTGGTAPTDPNLYDLGATATALGNTGGLVKTGLSFMGWNTAADGSGTSYLPGAAVTVTASTILYAQWGTGVSVFYDGNGNTAGSVPIDFNNPYPLNASVTVLDNTGNLTKTGQSFTNWNTAANGSGTSYNPGSTFTLASNTTLFARWTTNLYTATYLAGLNGTISGTVTQTVVYGSSCTPVAAVPNPGYRFVAWSDGVATASRTDAGFTSNLTVTATFDNNLVWNNSAGTTNWNTTDTNWTGIAWNNTIPDNAVFSGAAPGALTLTENITAGSVTLTAGTGYTLEANGHALLVAGDLAVSETTLRLTNGTFGFNRVITTNNSGSADWGALTIRIGATVTVTNGIDGSVGSPYTFALNLNGGDLYTPSIKVADLHQSWGNSYLTFNGTTVHATTDNSDFIQTYGGYGNNNTLSIANGGAIIDTAGHAITITKSLIDLPGHAGSLTKTGNGTLTLSGVNSYTGATTVSGGILSVSQPNLGGALIVSNGAVVELAYSGSAAVGMLVLDGVDKPTGTYGPTGSGAVNIDNVHFTGSGYVTVLQQNQDFTWTGAADFNWDTTTANWTNSTPLDTWVNNVFMPNRAIFDTNGVGTVTLAGPVSAAGLTFNAAGYTLTNSTLNLPNGATPIVVNFDATIESALAGNGGLTKTGNGTLTLTGANTFTNTATVSNGTLILGITNGNPQYGTLENSSKLIINSGATVRALGANAFKGWSGGFVDVTLNGGTLTVNDGATQGGNHNLGNVTLNGGTISGIGTTNYGGFNLDGALTVTDNSTISAANCSTDGGNRTVMVNAGKTLTWSGVIIDLLNGASKTSLTFSGPGTTVLSGSNTYSGSNVISGGTLLVNNSAGAGTGSGVVTVNGGTLGGNGAIGGSVTVNPGGTLTSGATAGAIGTLTINSNLTLNGNVLVALNKSRAQSNSVFAVSGGLTNVGTGTVTVTNLGPALAAGDKFTLFSQPVIGGASLTIAGPSGVTFVNHLAVDGSIVLPLLTPPVLQFTNQGNSLHFSWTGGGTLQIQTNSLSSGLGTNWVDYPGSSPVTVNINAAVGSVFFRVKQ